MPAASSATPSTSNRSSWVGGPDWLDSDRFDINAKTADADLDEKGSMPAAQFMLRLQALLEERFTLITHWKTRELPVYGLVVCDRRQARPEGEGACWGLTGSSSRRPIE